jgi:hypothetical protein
MLVGCSLLKLSLGSRIQNGGIPGVISIGTSMGGENSDMVTTAVKQDINVRGNAC